MNKKENALLRKLTKQFLYEDVSVHDSQGDTTSIDMSVESMIMDYGKISESDDEGLDVELFSSKVANLVVNHDKILDIPSFIVNDAIKYLEATYDLETAAEFKKILFDVYDIKLDSLESKPSAPLSGAAGPAGSA